MTQASPNRRLVLARLAGLSAIAVTGVAADAQSYPTRTIRIILPFPAGGLNDTVARLLQPHLERALGQTVIVDNRPGASGIIGTEAVTKAAPDGHTLLIVASSHTVTPAVNARLPYDTERDLAPIIVAAKGPHMFLINAKVPAKNLHEFVALVKAQPDKFNYSTPGAASQTHLLIELFSKRAGIRMQHVPYRGGASAILATVAGDVQFTVASSLASMSQIQAGSLRAIAVGSLARDPQFPDVPTVAESGYPGFEAVQWVGLFAPAGTPKDIVDRLNTVVRKALEDPALVAKLIAQGTSAGGGTPTEFRALIATEIHNWTEIAKAANIKAE
jgi:tripartite-type tricarboxylate transporter receptor subunit TctC